MDLELVSMLVMDGEPSMADREHGLAARMAAVAPQLRLIHCLIRQSLLCTKLSGELKEAMDPYNAMHRSSSAITRLYFLFLFLEYRDKYHILDYTS